MTVLFMKYEGKSKYQPEKKYGLPWDYTEYAQRFLLLKLENIGMLNFIGITIL